MTKDQAIKEIEAAGAEPVTMGGSPVLRFKRKGAVLSQSFSPNHYANMRTGEVRAFVEADLTPVETTERRRPHV